MDKYLGQYQQPIKPKKAGKEVKKEKEY